MHSVIIRHIVTIILQWRRLKWHQPNGGHAQALQVIQAIHDTAKVTDSVTICIHVCGDREAIDDRVLIPKIIDHSVDLLSFRSLCEPKKRGANHKMQATEW